MDNNSVRFYSIENKANSDMGFCFISGRINLVVCKIHLLKNVYKGSDLSVMCIKIN